MPDRKHSLSSVFRNILFMTGIIFLIYGLIVLCILGPNRIFNFFYIAAGLFLILFSKCRDTMNDSVRKILSVIILLLAVVFIIVETIIITYALKPSEKNADYVIVLGSQIRSDGPSIDFQARLDSAYAYFQENPDSKIICTGAKGPSEPVSEGQGGAEYLIMKGIPKEKILVEDQSFNTYQNLENAAKLISQEGKDPSETGIVVVSASYHLYRAHLLAKRIGFDSVTCKGGHGLWTLQPHYYTREFFALGKELLTTLR